MHTTPRLLDVVALLSEVPAHGLLRGQVGTVVEVLDGAYEVEFSDDEGRIYAGWRSRPTSSWSFDEPGAAHRHRVIGDRPEPHTLSTPNGARSGQSRNCSETVAPGAS